MAMILHENADLSKGGPLITFDDYTMNEDGTLTPVFDTGYEEVTMGKYARMHLKWLQEEHPERYTKVMLLEDTAKYLKEIDEQAEKMMDDLVEKQKKQLGVTEDLKAKDPLKWVGMVNNIIHSSEEVVLNEIVYR